MWGIARASLLGYGAMIAACFASLSAFWFPLASNALIHLGPLHITITFLEPI